ncbi:type IV pilus twitching motility protein PilT [bacterium]|nr:type IV pilus twitching motility protein PilT [bacterium]
MFTMEELVRIMVEKGASDIHLNVGTSPQLRIDGKLKPIEDTERLMPEGCQQLIYSVLNGEQKRLFEESGELDLSFGVKGIGRVRMNVFKQRGTVGAALRIIPNEAVTFKQLGLPNVVSEIVKLPQGLVLVTGPTGSGKSTTLASMVDWINNNRPFHILTVEDPIEHIHRHSKSVVSQREVNTDTKSFAASLKYALRQDPDVCLIGEMRDLETIKAALTIAETGHLVFATLHTIDAPQSVDRIVDVFPPDQQQMVKSQLSLTLQAVFCQQLLPRAEGKGRVLACEVMIIDSGIRALIRDGKTHQLYTAIQGGGEKGMQTMNTHLARLYKDGSINHQEAMQHTTKPEELKQLMRDIY